jgi:hypothetical protein
MYSGCESADLFILDTQSPRSEAYAASIGTIRREGGTVVPIEHGTAFDHDWLRRTVGVFQSFLLQSYDWVLFTEIDEFVLASTKGGDSPVDITLTGFVDEVREIRNPQRRVISATGYEVVHQPDEPTAKPEDLWLLRNRQFWYPSRLYSKPCLSCWPLEWSAGFHTAVGLTNPEMTPDPRLLLVHLHKYDFSVALARSQASAARNWSKADRDGRLGWQNRISTEEQLRQFFSRSVDDPNTAPTFTEIPLWVRQAI